MVEVGQYWWCVVGKPDEIVVWKVTEIFEDASGNIMVEEVIVKSTDSSFQIGEVNAEKIENYDQDDDSKYHLHKAYNSPLYKVLND